MQQSREYLFRKWPNLSKNGELRGTFNILFPPPLSLVPKEPWNQRPYHAENRCLAASRECWTRRELLQSLSPKEWSIFDQFLGFLSSVSELTRYKRGISPQGIYKKYYLTSWLPEIMYNSCGKQQAKLKAKKKKLRSYDIHRALKNSSLSWIPCATSRKTRKNPQTC